jgi:hypothetical protein
VHDSGKLRVALRDFGYGQSAVEAVWPRWWSEAAESSFPAQAELRFSVARNLGLDPRALVERDEPVPLWTGMAKFKRQTAESTRELDAITAYGVSLARLLTAATAENYSIVGVSAGELRGRILSTQQFVGLAELLSLCWAVGIPVIHLRVFPFDAKRMSAMSVRAGQRTAIILAKDADYPAPIAYYLAHELGHIAAGHIGNGAAIVDVADLLEGGGSADDEEREADRFGLELLTGRPDFAVNTTQRNYTAHALAESVLASGPSLRVEPGTLALCFGHATADWPRAMAALRTIYSMPHPVWREVNRVAESQLDWRAIPDDSAAFVQSAIR